MMGMFDEIRVVYPLPAEGFADTLWRTKSLDCLMDLYEIRVDGSLWVEVYDTENRRDPNAEGILGLLGCMARVNNRWVKANYTGEVRFYTRIGENDSDKGILAGWIEFSAYFQDGVLVKLNLIEHRQPQKIEEIAKQ